MTETTASDHSYETEPPRQRMSSAVRSLLVLGLVLLAMGLTDAVVSYLLMVALFTNPMTLVAIIPIAAATLVLVITSISKTVTGQRHVGGAVLVTVLLAGGGAFGFLNGILTPLAMSGDAPLHALLCVLCTLTFGLFLGPLAYRVVGAVACIGVFVFLSVAPTSADRIAAEAEQRDAQDRQQDIEYFLSQGVTPYISDAPGWSNVQLHPTGPSAMTWIVSDSGATATVLVNANAGPGAHNPCTWMFQPTDEPSTTVVPTWCEQTADGWSRADGNAVAFYAGDSAIIVNAADVNAQTQAGGSSAATAAEIAELVASLRPMTKDEVDTYILPVYELPDMPVIDTPGL